MRYVIICSKGVYPSVNSFWSYVFFRKSFPDEVLILYRDGDDADVVERAIRAIYWNHGREVEIIRKRMRARTAEEIRAEITGCVREGDVVDITGATKYDILSLLGTGIRAYYLHLEDGEFRQELFLKKPLPLQRTMEVVL